MRSIQRRRYIPIITGLVLGCLILSGCGEGQAQRQTPRADLVTINAMAALGDLARPPVPFLHDKHTRALPPEVKDCGTCHPRLENGRFSMKYMRTAEVKDKDALMELYHENCLKCHRTRMAEDEKSGPAYCGFCHQRHPEYIPGQVPIGFDKSLHHRHAKAMKMECGKCHHVFDAKTDTIVYVKGQESSCRDCHHGDTLRIFSHQACIGCHVELQGEGGPIECSGCHDPERQKEIKVVKNPARLMRNQPDFVLLSVKPEELSLSKMNTVPFPHKLHEEFNSTCRICHHETMKPCVECHTLSADTSRNAVPLQQAMHDMGSNHSCVGCHNLKKSDTTCAGCHDLMEQGKLSERSCNICHTGPAPASLERLRVRYTSIKQFEPTARQMALSFKKSEIPDSVSVRILAKKYEPVIFPHRRIFNKLLGDTKTSGVATYFHNTEDVLCQGCHHQSPVGKTPPLCENCHGEPFNEEALFKPGLYGAYHRQCIGCHRSMKMAHATECSFCHKDAKFPTMIADREGAE
jgi:hypothetical protein